MLTFLSQLQANTMKCLRLRFVSPCGQISELFVGSLLSRDGLQRWRAGLARFTEKPIADEKPSVNRWSIDYDIEKEIDIQTGDAPAGPY